MNDGRDMYMYLCNITIFINFKLTITRLITINEEAIIKQKENKTNDSKTCTTLKLPTVTSLILPCKTLLVNERLLQSKQINYHRIWVIKRMPF